MITITRRQARSLRGVFRRSALGIAHRGLLPPLLLLADGDRVRVRYRSADIAVEWVVPAAGPSSGSVLLPLDALADLEGRDDAPLALDPAAPDRTVARWADRGIPQARKYAVPGRPQPGTFPELPAEWSEAPADLPDALAEAAATTVAGSTRYALDCLLLRGGPDGGEVVATDGHQVLIRGGFAFPWDGDVLARSSPVFAARDLPRDRPWSVGRADAHVACRCGPFTILLAVPAEARYPRVDQIVPDPAAAIARLRIDPTDAAFLAGSLGRLPGADAPLAPVTVDLNGHVAVRAGGPADPAATAELVLSRSSYAGIPVRFGTDRNLLARALRLGFAEVEVGEPAAPLVCRDGRTTYAWQPLSPDSALGPNAELARVESDPQAPTANLQAPEPPRAPFVPPPVADRPQVGPPRAAIAEDPAETGLLALVREAESLHEALGAARARSQRLVVALKRHRKQARLMAATLRGLRQLQAVAE